MPASYPSEALGSAKWHLVTGVIKRYSSTTAGGAGECAAPCRAAGAARAGFFAGTGLVVAAVGLASAGALAAAGGGSSAGSTMSF